MTNIPSQVVIFENPNHGTIGTSVGIGTTVQHCPLPKILWTSPNCGLTTVQIAAKDIPSGCKYEIINESDVEDYFRVGIGSTALLFQRAITNYDFDTKQSTYDLTMAKKVAHRKRRNRRYSEFAPKDVIVSKAIPGATDAAEASRAAIRTKYATMQTEIDAASTIDELYAIMEKYPSFPRPPEAEDSGYERWSLEA